MARLPRLYAPRIPQLVQARFARPLAERGDPAPAALLDRTRGWLAEEVQRQPVALHAWALLPDRVVLLLTPANEHAAALVMQALGRRMGSGLLRARVYAGRYHNALLEPGRWVLPAMVWAETLAVRQREVDQAARWPWSSAAEHMGLAGGPAERPAINPAGISGLVRVPPPGEPSPARAPELSDHPDYWQIGDTPFARQAAWRQRLQAGLDEAQQQSLEAALHGQWALGEKIFLSHLSRLATRRVSPAPRGRPRKTKAGAAGQ